MEIKNEYPRRRWCRWRRWKRGYVVPSIGSGISGTSFTISAYPNSGNYLESLTVTDKDGVSTSLTYKVDETTNVVVSESLTMKEGGYVISANFETSSSLGTTGYVDGTKYNGTYDAAGNFVPTTPVSGAPVFAGGNGSESDPLQIENNEQFASITKSGENYFVLNQSLVGDNAVSSLPTPKESETLSIDLDGNTLESNSNSASSVAANSEITYKNGTLVANKISQGHVSVIGIGNSAVNSKVTFENMDIETTGTPVYTSAVDSEINVINSILIGGTYALGTNANQGSAETSPVTINITGSTLISEGNDYTNTALFINIGAEVTVTDSTLQGDRHALVVRGGNVALENTIINYTGYGYTKLAEEDRTDLYDTTTWYAGNGVPTAAIFIGNNEENAYSGKSILTLKDLTLNEIDPEGSNTNSLNTLSDGSKINKPEKPYLLYAYGESEKNNVTLNLDSTSYEQFKQDEGRVFLNDKNKVIMNIEGKEVTSTNTFVDGILYSKLYLNEDGSVDETLSTRVEGVEFAGGDGLSEETALLINDDKQFSLINNTNVINSGALYFKVQNEGKSLTHTGNLPIEGRNETVIDLTDTTLTLNSADVTHVGREDDSSINEVKLTLKGTGEAKIDYNNSNTGVTQTSISVNNNGNLTIDGVNIESTGGPVGIFGNNSKVSVNNSLIIAADNKGQSYAVSTNAKNYDQTETEITITNSILVANTPVMFNVKGTLTIDNCILNGCRQGVFVRTGVANISNSIINFSGLQPYQNTSGINTYYNIDWKTGNSGPSAAILVGNRNSSYLLPATVNLSNVNFMRIPLDVSENINYYQTFEDEIDGIFKLWNEKDIVTDLYSERMDHLLYAYQNGEEQPVIINLDKTSFDNLSNDYSYNNGVTINIDGEQLVESENN